VYIKCIELDVLFVLTSYVKLFFPKHLTTLASVVTSIVTTSNINTSNITLYYCYIPRFLLFV
jgi:hypothetical protein